MSEETQVFGEYWRRTNNLRQKIEVKESHRLSFKVSGKSMTHNTYLIDLLLLVQRKLNHIS